MSRKKNHTTFISAISLFPVVWLSALSTWGWQKFVIVDGWVAISIGNGTRYNQLIMVIVGHWQEVRVSWSIQQWRWKADLMVKCLYWISVITLINFDLECPHQLFSRTSGLWLSQWQRFVLHFSWLPHYSLWHRQVGLPMCCYELYYVRLFTFILKITQFLYCFCSWMAMSIFWENGLFAKIHVTLSDLDAD